MRIKYEVPSNKYKTPFTAQITPNIVSFYNEIKRSNAGSTPNIR